MRNVLAVPLRHDVVAVAQHAVERAQARDQLGPRRRRHRQVRPARRPPGSRTPIRLLEPSVSADFEPKRSSSSAPGRLAARDAHGEQIEVEHVQPLLDQREVRPAVLALDAELARAPGSRASTTPLAAAAVEVFERERPRPSRCAARRRGRSSRPRRAGRAPCAGCRAGCRAASVDGGSGTSSVKTFAGSLLAQRLEHAPARPAPAAPSPRSRCR